MTFLIQGWKQRDRTRSGSSAKAFQAWQQASTMASKSGKTRRLRKRSRSRSQTRSIGFSCGEQGGRGTKVTFGGTLRALDAVPARAVEDHDGVLVFGDRFGEGVEEGLHGLRADLGQDEAEGAPAVGAGGAEHAAPLEALVLAARRAAAPAPPATAEPALPADPHLVLEPQGDPLGGMGFGRCLQRRAEPPFSKRRCAASSVFGCVGRTFWREKPSRRRIRDRLCGLRRLSNRASSQRQRSGRVQLLTPSVSGSGPRKTRSKSNAGSASLSAGGRPGSGRPRTPAGPSAL